MTGETTWKSPGAPGERRGIVLPALSTPAVRGSLPRARGASGLRALEPAGLQC